VRGRLRCLRLHWAAYEDVFEEDPNLKSVNVMDCVKDRELPGVVAERLRVALEQHEES